MANISLNNTKWAINGYPNEGLDILSNYGSIGYGYWNVKNTTIYWNGEVYDVSAIAVGYDYDVTGMFPDSEDNEGWTTENFSTGFAFKTSNGQSKSAGGFTSFRLDIGEITSGDVDSLYSWLNNTGEIYKEPITTETLFKEKMDSLATSIVNKAGVSGKKNLDELKELVDNIEIPEEYDGTIEVV